MYLQLGIADVSISSLCHMQGSYDLEYVLAYMFKSLPGWSEEK